MKVLCDYQGWAKLHRSLFQTPVWDDAAAFRTYAALLVSATHLAVLDTVNGIHVRLQPGQLTATQSEICDITGFGRKTVRNSLDILTAERAISCHCAPERKFSIVTVHTPPYSLYERKKGAKVGPTDSQKTGQPFQECNVSDGGRFGIAAELTGANGFSETGPTPYRNKELKESKNKKNILFSPSVLSILSLWRSARERVGEPYCEDPATLEGAALMAELWMDSEKATETQIAGAMARFVHVVRTNEAASLYTLKTLANSLGTYLEKTAVKEVKTYSWTYTCSACGYTTAGFYKETVTPEAYSCTYMLNRETRCTGTMIPKRENG